MTTAGKSVAVFGLAVVVAKLAAGQSDTATADTSTMTAGTARVTLVGTVEVEGGGALPSEIRLIQRCSTESRDLGRTNSAGEFSVPFAPSGEAVRFGADCSVEAAASGYDSRTVKVSTRADAGMMNIGTLRLQQHTSSISVVAGKDHETTTVSLGSLKAPPAAKKAYEKGMSALQRNKGAEASAYFEAAVKEWPSYAEAWLGLGRARVQINAPDAEAALQRAITEDGKLAGPWQELGFLSAKKEQWPDAARYLDQSLKLDPSGSFLACYFDAVANFSLKRYDQAEGAARAALGFGDKGFQSRAHYLLGMTLLSKQNYSGAREELTQYLKFVPDADARTRVENELRHIEQLAGAVH